MLIILGVLVGISLVITGASLALCYAMKCGCFEEAVQPPLQAGVQMGQMQVIQVPQQGVIQMGQMQLQQGAIVAAQPVMDPVKAL